MSNNQKRKPQMSYVATHRQFEHSELFQLYFENVSSHWVSQDIFFKANASSRPIFACWRRRLRWNQRLEGFVGGRGTNGLKSELRLWQSQHLNACLGNLCQKRPDFSKDLWGWGAAPSSVIHAVLSRLIQSKHFLQVQKIYLQKELYGHQDTPFCVFKFLLSSTKLSVCCKRWL